MNQAIRLLKKQLNESSDVGSQMDILNKLARTYMYRDITLVQQYATQALDLAKSYHNSFEMVRAYVSLGAKEAICRNLKNSIHYYHLAFDLLGNDPLSEVRIYMGICNTYLDLENFNKAKEYCEKALELSIAHQLLSEEIACYNNFGRIYRELERYEIADNFFEKGIRLTEIHNKSLLKGYLCVNQVKNLFSWKHVEHIEEKLLKLEELIDHNNELWFVGVLQGLWGMFYAYNEIPDYAKERFELAISILEDEEQLINLLSTYVDYCETLIQNNRYLQAKSIYSRAITYLETRDIKDVLPTFTKTMAKFYKEIGDIKSSLQYLKDYEATKLSLTNYIEQYF